MGNSKSKIKSGSRGKFHRKNGQKGLLENSASREDERTDTELLLLRRTIERNPEIFILNNLMMCVQFFGNYEEEMKHVKETLVTSRETELNKRLPPQKHALLPDVIQEHIAQKVGFTSTRQTFRPTIEPLQPVRIYTVHDNVDIVEQNFPTHYSSVNHSLMYNIRLKPTQHQGYVQLQLLDELCTSKEPKKVDEMDLSSIAENDEIYSDNDSVYGPKPRSDLSACSIESGRTKPRIRENMKYKHARSLPNLRDEEFASDNRAATSSSSRNVRAETDYDGSSSEERRHRNERAWTKDELSSREDHRAGKHLSSKKQGPTNQDLASSNSSGYRSDVYAADSDSSCTPASILSRSSRFSQSSNYEQLDPGWIMSGGFPNRCFKKVTHTAEGRLYDPREDKVHLLNSKQRRIKLALKRHNYDLFYVSSTEFMKHFIRLFVKRLAESFGFDQECVEDAKREGCVLYCDKIMVSSAFQLSQVEQYEIIPAIWLQWPICAQEWLDRPRSTWPDYDDVNKIKDYGCYVVPEGFVPKTGNSSLIEDLEWQLTFPTAERYLETCMTQAQVQVYLIALMLHKTFMRPIFDTMFGLTAAHIRHKLFWMIEENDRPSKWPDTRMGECLLTLLQSLYSNIGQNDPMLKDYFIKGRNLFHRVPCEHLLHTQKQLKRITENPVMYVFHAMENIRYSDNFFPRLDFEMLLKILTVDTLALVNPALTQHISKLIPRIDEEYARGDDKYDRTGFWDTVKNQRSKHSMQVVTNRTLINPRKATDSIIEISTRCAELEGPRLCALLDFFIRHFIKIAERFNQYQAHQQKATYLEHADRLSILLFEHHRYKEDARAYRDKIKVLGKKSAGSRSTGDPPQIPKRNAETAVYVVPLKDRFAREVPSEISPSTVANSVEKTSAKESVRGVHFEEPEEQNVSSDKETSSTSTVNHQTTYI